MFNIGDSISNKPIGAFAIFDKSGTLLSRQLFDIPQRTDIGTNSNTLIRTKDGGFAYGGWAQGTTATQNSLLLLKYDQHGVFQWYNEIIDTNYLYFYPSAFIQDSFSNYYFTGVVVQQISNDQDIYIAKTDSLGNLIYMKVFNDSTLDDAGSGLCINNKGHIVLSGSGSSRNLSNDLNFRGYMKMFEIDSGGNIINYIINSDSNGPGLGNIIALKNGEYIATGAYVCDKGETFIKQVDAITMLDSAFNIKWRTDFATCSIYNSLLSLNEAPDGSFITTGVTYTDDTILYAHPQNGIILKISGNGDIIWSKEYWGLSITTNSDVNGLASVGFLSDSSIITGGEALDYSDSIHPQQGWLLHLDTAGCLPDSNTCGIPDGIVTIPQAAGSVRAYPDPASDRIQFDVVLDRPSGYTLHITDLLGQAISDISIPPQSTTTTIDVRSWSPGLYLYRVSSDYGFAATRRFIVSH